MNPISSAGRDRPLLPARAVGGFLRLRVDRLYILAAIAGLLVGLAGWAW